MDLTVNGDETVQPAPFRLDAGFFGVVQAAKVKKKPFKGLFEYNNINISGEMIKRSNFSLDQDRLGF